MKNILLQLADTPKPNKFAEGGDLQSNIKDVINVVIGILGLVCVIVMIIGGINYMTSAGDAAKKGKDTILYGLIGLVICVLAYALVNWVIGSVLAGV